MAEVSKPCSMCSEVKPLEAYSVDRRHADGRQSRCLVCHRAYQKRWKTSNPDTYRETRKREYEKSRASGKRQAYVKANRERANFLARERVARLDEEERELLRASHREAQNAYRGRNPELTGRRIAAWRKANPGLARHYVHVRRVRTRGREAVERFTRQEIGDRDGWVCGICADPIDPNLRWPDHMSQSLDHVLPLSLGGEHSRANSRISHYICNVRRGARVRTEVAEARKEAERG